MSKQVGGNHYATDEVKMDVIDFCDQYKLGNREFSAIKYLTRHKRKNGAEDVCKAIDYCCRILTDVYKIALDEECINHILQSYKQVEKPKYEITMWHTIPELPKEGSKVLVSCFDGDEVFELVAEFKENNFFNNETPIPYVQKWCYLPE